MQPRQLYSVAAALADNVVLRLFGLQEVDQAALARQRVCSVQRLRNSQ